MLFNHLIVVGVLVVTVAFNAAQNSENLAAQILSASDVRICKKVAAFKQGLKEMLIKPD